MKNKKWIQFSGLGLCIGLLISPFVFRGWFLGWQNTLQNKFYDLASPSPEIIIVDIDEKSLSADQLGPLSAWPRAHYAKAINLLNQQGASVIGIDITFPDASPKGEADDLILSKTLSIHSNVVLAGHYFFENKTRQFVWPNETLLKAKPQLGWLNVSLDGDGMVRKIPLFTRTKDGVIEAFSVAIARKHLKQEPAGHLVKNGQFSFSDQISLPAFNLKDEETKEEVSFMHLNYFAEPGAYRHLSMSDLLKEQFIDKRGDKINFEDKIVLIGPTALDLQDYYLSPVGSGLRMAGVEIHANAIQTLTEQRFLRDQSALSLWLFLLATLLINLFLFARLKIRWAIPLAVLEAFGFMLAGILFYDEGIFLKVIYPLFTLIFTFVGVFLLRFLLEQSKRKFVEGAFGHYVNKSVVDEILKDPTNLELGGVKKEVTAFFSDIAGFTSISEQMEPGQLVHFLNEYLDKMTQVILNHQGTLDKYEGDAIMAFWGAPLDLPNHPLEACLAALENQKVLAQLRPQWQQQGLPPIEVRIGINTGEVIAGNMGSEDRFDYTIMGDAVNLASRLEGVNKQYGTRIIISENTYVKVKDQFIVRELDQIRVKGKKEPVRIYELIGKAGEVANEQIQLINTFHQGLAFYRQKNFLAAEAEFKKAPQDPPSAVFAQRCAYFMKNPPAEGWDGVYTFNVK